MIKREKLDSVAIRIRWKISWNQSHEERKGKKH